MTSHFSPLNRRHFLGAALGSTLAAEHAFSIPTSHHSDADPFTFAVIADPHCAESEKPGLEALGDGIAKLMRCFDRMRELPDAKQPDFVLMAGDIHPEALATHLSKIPYPIHAVAGNHEGSAKSRGLLRTLFPKDFGTGDQLRDYYSFTHKGVRFIGLCNAGCGGDHIGHFCSELITPQGQCEWLEKQLTENADRKVIFAHIPPAMDGSDLEMHLSRNDARWLIELLQRIPPALLFFGHLHQATQEDPLGNSKMIRLRSCCWNFQRAPVGFMLVHVTPEAMTTEEIFTGEYV